MADGKKAGAARKAKAATRGEAEKLARRYWRLWRRNFRPPFDKDDAPQPASERGRK